MELIEQKNKFKESKIDITAITNPFKPFDSKILKQVPYIPGAAIPEYLGELLEVDQEDWDIIISVNGLVLPEDQIYSFTPVINDNIVFCLKPRGGDEGKNVAAMIAMAALVVVAPYTVAAMGVPALGMTASTLTFWGHVAQFGLIVGGGLLINAIFPPPSVDSDDSSPTYGWNSETNQIGEGHAWPVLYGTAKVVPYLISRHITTDDDKQYLNLLFAVADHAVDSITDIKIDEVAYTNYEDIEVQIRYGALDQEVIPYFHNSSTEKTVGYKLDEEINIRPDYSITTDGNQVEELAIGVNIPSGVFALNSSGGKEFNTINISIWYRPVGGTWETLEVYHRIPGEEDHEYEYTLSTNIRIFGKTSETVRRQYVIKDLDPDQYEVSVGFCVIPNTDDKHYGSDCYWEYLQETIYQEFTFPGVSLIGIKALATDQLNSSQPKITCIASRNYVDIYDPVAEEWVQKYAHNPAWICYDILVNDFYGGAISEDRIIYNEFNNWGNFCSNTYLCGIYFDTILDLVQAKSRVETIGRGLVVQKGTNFGVIIDKPETPVQLFGEGNILQGTFKQSFLPKSERATVIDLTFWDSEDNYEQKTITVFGDNYDPAEPEIKSQVILYASVTKTLAYEYVKFLLNCNQYQLRTVEFQVDIDAIACSIGDVVNVASDVPQWGYSGRVVTSTETVVTIDRDIDLYPLVDYSIMVRHLTDDSLETKAISFAGSTSYDKTKAWVSGAHYAVSERVSYSGFGNFICAIEHIADETNRPDLSSPEWTSIDYILVDTFVLSSAWSTTPADGVVMSIGEIDKIVKPFRVLTITRTQELQRKITGIEYIEGIYTDTVDIDDIQPISSLALVTGLIAKEIWEASGGSGVSAVHLSWRGVAISWNVFYKSEDGDWLKVATVSKPTYTVYNLVPGKQYTFAVSYNNNPLDGVTAVVNFTGDPEIPSIDVPDVPNLEICGQGTNTVWQDKDLPLCWTAVSTLWMNEDGELPSGAGVSASQTSYWLRIYNVSDGTLRREILLYDNKYIYSYGMNFTDGEGTPSSNLIIRVWAVDQYGNQSINYAEITVSNPAPAAVSGLASEPFMHACRFSWSVSSEPDFSHYKYRFLIGSGSWGDWETTFNTWVLKTLSESEVGTYGADALITIEVIAIDTFGNESSSQTTSCNSEGLNIAPTDIEDFAVTASKMFTRVPVLEGEIWTGNSVDTVSWNAHSLYYQGIEFQIASGQATSKYIYWVCPVSDWNDPPASPVASAYWQRASHPGDDGILTEHDFIICVNLDGEYNPAWNAIANQIIGSAYIMNAAINDAHVNSLSAAKITTGQLTAAVGNNYFDIATGVFHLEDTGGTHGLDWNPTTGELMLYGVLHQSSSGINFPIPTYRGGYSSELTYYKGDVVTYGGSTWIYIYNTADSGHTPENGIYWQVFASKGEQGEAGSTGSSGLDGIGVIYRGEFAAGTVYYNNSVRREVVLYSDHYYLYIGSDALENTSWVSERWQSFGAEFSSVATDILLAQDVNITKALVFGNQHITVDGTNNRIIVAGDGGTSGNDFALLEQGLLKFFYWDSSISDHREYASVRRIESGKGAMNGVEIEIPGVFKNQPHVIISPHELRSYNVDTVLQSQKLSLSVNGPTSYGANNLQWKFTPKAELITDSSDAGPFPLTIDIQGSGGDEILTSGRIDEETDSIPSAAFPSNVRTVEVSGQCLGAYFVIGGGYSAWKGVYRDIILYIYTNSAWVQADYVTIDPADENAEDWFGFNLSGTSSTDIEHFKVRYYSEYLSGTSSLYKYGLQLSSYTLGLTGSTVLSSGTVDWIAIGN